MWNSRPGFTNRPRRIRRRSVIVIARRWQGSGNGPRGRLPAGAWDCDFGWRLGSVEARDEIGAWAGGALRVAGILLGTFAILAGIGVMRGLLTDVFVRSYNVGLFLAATLGVQWLILLVGLVGYSFVRRQPVPMAICLGSALVTSWEPRALGRLKYHHRRGGFGR